MAALIPTQDDYTTTGTRLTTKRRPQPGDADYTAADPYAPNAPVPSATTQTQAPGDTPPPPDDPNAMAYAGNTPGGFNEKGIYYNPDDATKYGGTYVNPTASGKTTTPTVGAPVDALIAQGLNAGYGRTPTQQDLDYWRAAYQQWGYKDPNYFLQRVMGMSAGGADAATQGPYAGGTASSGFGGGFNFNPSSFASALSAIGTRGVGGAGGGGTPGAAGQDPFASMGGGVFVDGGWKPKSMYTDEQLAQIAAQQTGQPAGAATPGTGGVTQADLDAERNKAILEMLQRKPPTAEELRDTPENQAYQLQSQRGAERMRADLAERAAQEGFADTGYFDTELAGQQQQRAEGEAGFLGQLAISRIQAQREDLQYAIDQARNSGQFDKAQELQKQAMALDAALRREQMASSERMAANDLALREFLGRAGLDLDKLRLTQQGQQFLDQLGLSYDQLGYNYAALKVGGNAQGYNAAINPPG